MVKNGGTDYRPKGDPWRVNVHYFEDKKLGKVLAPLDGAREIVLWFTLAARPETARETRKFSRDRRLWRDVGIPRSTTSARSMIAIRISARDACV
jgi:hypothetical protein